MIQPEIMHTTRRWGTSRDFPQPPGKGPNGRRFCRMCHQEVGKGRRTFCSEKCVDAYWVRVSGQEVRRQVYLRDHGICSACGIDAAKLERIARWARWHLQDISRWHRKDGSGFFIICVWIVQRRVLDGMEGNWSWQGNCLWQPDHILPVVDGGGMCGLSNYRTLCSPCHLAVTTVGRRALAKGKRLGTKAAKHDTAMQLKWRWAVEA